METINHIYLRANTRKSHLEKFENICKENGFVKSGEQVVKNYTSPYVIMYKNDIIGYFAIDDVALDNVACFWGFYIFPKYRNNGYGTATLLKVIMTCAKMKFDALYCYFQQTNQVATHIYLKYGYLMGKDGRLYDDFTSCSNPRFRDTENVAVFFKRGWGNTNLTVKKELQNVFDSHNI